MWSGILFFLAAAAAAAQLELAVDLFAEGDWAACRRECLRVLHGDPQQETARVLEAVARLRLQPRAPRPLAALSNLAAQAAGPEVRNLAAYELGRARWQQGDRTNAFRLLLQAYQHAAAPALALRSGCALYRLRQADPTLGTDQPSLIQQLDTSRAAWTDAVWSECAPARPRSEGGPFALPGKWLVAFYRTQIRPAIGSRCSLVPSCSEYALQAAKRHGLLAMPMAADRLVREPSVVAAAQGPVPAAQGLLFADPLAAHDWWLKGKDAW